MLIASVRQDIQFIEGTGRVTLSSASSINLPANLEPGDLVIVASTSDGTTPTYATGYTAGQRGREEGVGYQWCYKIMPNPVDTTATGLTSNSTTTHLAIAFRNVNQANPLDVTPPAIFADEGSNINPPAITTVTNGAMVVALGFLDDDRIANTLTEPTGYILSAASQSSSTGATVMAAHKLIPIAKLEDPPNFTTTSDDHAGATLALRPQYL
jgi:hypothetical protein